MCFKVSTIGFEKGARELRAIVSDDTVGDPKAAHEALDEFDDRPSRDGAHRLHLRPFGEFVDGEVEVAVASSCSGKRAQDIQPPNYERP